LNARKCVPERGFSRRQGPPAPKPPGSQGRRMSAGGWVPGGRGSERPATGSGPFSGRPGPGVLSTRRRGCSSDRRPAWGPIPDQRSGEGPVRQNARKVPNSCPGAAAGPGLRTRRPRSFTHFFGPAGWLWGPRPAFLRKKGRAIGGSFGPLSRGKRPQGSTAGPRAARPQGWGGSSAGPPTFGRK